MAYWDTAEEKPSLPEHELEFARIWKDTPKIVFSKTLEKVEGSADCPPRAGSPHGDRDG